MIGNIKIKFRRSIILSESKPTKKQSNLLGISNKCLNGGKYLELTVLDSLRTFKCICNVNFTGLNCETSKITKNFNLKIKF
jgi:hypothetical protein